MNTCLFAKENNRFDHPLSNSVERELRRGRRGKEQRHGSVLSFLLAIQFEYVLSRYLSIPYQPFTFRFAAPRTPRSTSEHPEQSGDHAMAPNKSRTPAAIRATSDKMTPAKKLKFDEKVLSETQTPSCSWNSVRHSARSILTRTPPITLAAHPDSRTPHHRPSHRPSLSRQSPRSLPCRPPKSRPKTVQARESTLPSPR